MADDRSGDPACWVEQVCDVCGGFVENDGDHECRRPVSPGEADPSSPPGV